MVPDDVSMNDPLCNSAIGSMVTFDYVTPDTRNAQLKERQKWSHEKPKLDNARKLRGIYFIDPEDKEFKRTIKNARKKLETPMAPAFLCKTSKNSQHGVTRGDSNEIKSKLACILEASESTNCVWENLYRIIIKTMLQERRQFTASLQFGTQIYSDASSHEDSRSKGSSGQGMGKIGKASGVEPDESQK